MRIVFIFLILLTAANVGLSIADWLQFQQIRRMDALCQANPTLCK